MPRRLLSAVLLAILLASCTGSATPAPATVVPSPITQTPTSTASPEATATPASPDAAARPTPPAPTAGLPLAPPTPTPPPTTAARPPWSLAVVGDSIPYNNPKDCPGCTGVADRYAAAIERATGRLVALTNLSEYTGLRVEGLLAELRSDAARRTAIAGADVVLITIAHNNVVCPDWDAERADCAALAEEYRATFHRVFATVVALRAGRPTVFRTVNRYNDVIEPGATEGEAAGSKLILDAWNEMVCTEAAATGFLCADLYHAFNGADGLTPSGDLLADDFTHPSDLGNERIAGVLADLGYAPLWP